MTNRNSTSIVRKWLYLALALLGTVVPWLFFATFFSSEDANFSLFFRSLFANGAAGGFSADVLISILVFWIWSFYDARKYKIRYWWTVIPAGFCVGLSLALPLYLFFREDVDASSGG